MSDDLNQRATCWLKDFQNLNIGPDQNRDPVQAAYQGCRLLDATDAPPLFETAPGAFEKCLHDLAPKSEADSA